MNRGRTPRGISLGLGLFLALLPGCQRIGPAAPPIQPGVHNLILEDTAGRIVLTADFHWPVGILTPGRNFTGEWQPAEVAPGVPQPWGLGSRTPVAYHAEIAAEGISVNLSFGHADDNVYLLGRETGGVFTGSWSRSTLAGSRVLGNFTLREDHP